MPLNPGDKQIIKDAIFEFMRDTNGPPSGYDAWPFIQSSVWNAPQQAQDAEGRPLVDDNGNPIRYSSAGFLVSTNAVTNALKDAEPTEASSPLVAPAWAIGILLGLITAVEIVRAVADLVA